MESPNTRTLPPVGWASSFFGAGARVESTGRSTWRGAENGLKNESNEPLRPPPPPNPPNCASTGTDISATPQTDATPSVARLPSHCKNWPFAAITGSTGRGASGAPIEGRRGVYRSLTAGNCQPDGLALVSARASGRG